MRRRNGRLAMTLVTVLLGFLVVVQLRSQASDAGLASLSAQDLTVLVANLTTRNDQLREEITELDRQRRAVADAVERGDSSAGQIRSDLNRVRAWAGLLPVKGPGVRVIVDGPISGEAIAGLLNELRNAGAEAIAVGDIRVVVGVVVTGPTGGPMIDGRAAARPIEITAIGQQESITGSLTRAGGPIALLGVNHPDVTVTVSAEPELFLPATTRSLVPQLGRPRI